MGGVGADDIGERGNERAAWNSEPCSEIVPESDTEFCTGLVEPEKGIAAVAAGVAAGLGVSPFLNRSSVTNRRRRKRGDNWNAKFQCQRDRSTPGNVGNARALLVAEIAFQPKRAV